jgi:hypothetical protein
MTLNFIAEHREKHDLFFLCAQQEIRKIFGALAIRRAREFSQLKFIKPQLVIGVARVRPCKV